MSHPYEGLDRNSYWRTGVADCNSLQIRGLWKPKFRVQKKHKIVTAGSCFAQHIGNALAARGYHWFDAEPAPESLPDAIKRDYNYGIFSFRTGNIYTAKMLLQWLELAYGLRAQIDEVWEKDGRFFDPLRPAIEPDGFASRDELIAAREAVYAAIRKAVSEADIFVFTLGLTESWRNIEHDFEYALCPGTVTGAFDPQKHEFVNHKHASIFADVRAALRIMREQNRKLKMLVTVSPVPLTATASGQHVLTATTYSKSVLRGVAGQLCERFKQVDYFPSYEIITSPVYRGMFYAPNMRSVVPEGVAVVMSNFFDDQQAAFGAEKVAKVAKPVTRVAQARADDVKCEEDMLDAFAR